MFGTNVFDQSSMRRVLVNVDYCHNIFSFVLYLSTKGKQTVETFYELDERRINLSALANV